MDLQMLARVLEKMKRFASTPDPFEGLMEKFAIKETRSGFENICVVRQEVQALSREIYEAHGLPEPPEGMRGDVPEVIRVVLTELRIKHAYKGYEVVESGLNEGDLPALPLAGLAGRSISASST